MIGWDSDTGYWHGAYEDRRNEMFIEHRRLVLIRG